MADILLLSDTHLFQADKLPDCLFTDSEQCELIVHCGDIVSAEIIQVLSALKPVKYVVGNSDPRREFPGSTHQQIFEFHGKRIGLTHGIGAFGREDELLAKFQGLPVDVIMFGHTHKKKFKKKDGVCFINPGSVSEPRDGSASYAIVSVEKNAVGVRFVKVESKG